MILSNTIRTAGVAAAILFTAAGPALAGSITPTYDTFGELAGATFGGSGIPNDAVAITTIMHGGNTITLGLTAHQRFFNPPLGNDGAGTFSALPGANFGDPSFMTMPSGSLGATWNFAFYVDIDIDTMGSYLVELLYDFDPGANTDETALGTINLGVFSQDALLEDSQNLNFSFLAATIPGFITPPMGTFDPFAGGEYSFSLRVSEVDAEMLGEAAINVNVVSEPGTLAVLGLGLAGLGAIRRRRR